MIFQPRHRPQTSDSSYGPSSLTLTFLLPSPRTHLDRIARPAPRQLATTTITTSTNGNASNAAANTSTASATHTTTIATPPISPGGRTRTRADAARSTLDNSPFTLTAYLTSAT